MKLSQVLLGAGLLASATIASAKVSDGHNYGDWRGTCEGDQCAVVQVLNNNDKQPIGRAVLRKLPQAKDTPVLILTVPLGVNLQAGLGVAVDTKEIARVPYDFCDQGGCNAAIPLITTKDGKDLLAAIKGGKELDVAVFVGQNQQGMKFSLSGVTSAINAL